ncbi:hypothetical protein JXA40_07035 [bacterium]|nr:hypothetical protein [candidate division CSSED10-310 bacterium]
MKTLLVMILTWLTGWFFSVSAREIHMDLQMPGILFTPGMTCGLDLVICNDGPAVIDGHLYVALSTGSGDYWFYPSWCRYPGAVDRETISIPEFSQSIRIVIPEFTWPDGTGEFDGALFLALITRSDQILSNVAEYSFGWSELPDGTPTPGFTGTPTPVPTPADFKALIAMGLGRDLWTVDGTDYSVEKTVTFTEYSPCQITVHGDRFYVVNSLSHSIGEYNATTYGLLREISVGPGRNPMMMAFSDPNVFWVTNYVSNTVSTVDLASGSVIREIDLPVDLPRDPGVSQTWARPAGITIIGRTAYVACANQDESFTSGGPGIVCRIDTDTMQVTGWFETGGRNTLGIYHEPRWPDLLWIVSAGDYVVGQGFTGNGSICRWSLISQLPIGCIPVEDAPFEMAFGPERAYLASARDGVVGRIDLGTLQLLDPVMLPTAGHGLNFVSGLDQGPDGLVWTLEFNHDMLYLLDPSQNDMLIRSVEMGDGPDALAFVLDGGF